MQPTCFTFPKSNVQHLKILKFRLKSLGKGPRRIVSYNNVMLQHCNFQVSVGHFEVQNRSSPSTESYKLQLFNLQVFVFLTRYKSLQGTWVLRRILSVAHFHPLCDVACSPRCNSGRALIDMCIFEFPLRLHAPRYVRRTISLGILFEPGRPPSFEHLLRRGTVKKLAAQYDGTVEVGEVVSKLGALGREVPVLVREGRCWCGRCVSAGSRDLALIGTANQTSIGSQQLTSAIEPRSRTRVVQCHHADSFLRHCTHALCSNACSE